MSPKLNPALISSLVSEVEESDALAREISAFLVSSNFEDAALVRSWKYPTTPSVRFNAIDALKKQRGTAGEMYILLLELAYDRIHSVLGLMIGFIKNKNTDSLCSRGEPTMVEEARGWNEGTATVASAAKLVWSELKRQAGSRVIVQYERRIAFLDESRQALASRLATMTETKVALEEIRKGTSPHRRKKNESIILVDENINDKRQRSWSEDDESRVRGSVAFLTPGDDPLVDMTRELVSNRDKIDALTRQNERITRIMARIKKFRGD